MKKTLLEREAVTAESPLTTIKFRKVAENWWQWYNTIGRDGFIEGDTKEVNKKLNELKKEGFSIRYK